MLGYFIFFCSFVAIIWGLVKYSKNNPGQRYHAPPPHSSKAISNDKSWDISPNGNPILVVDDFRLTVFRHGEGWKYCAADNSDDDDPFFSVVYGSGSEARTEALKWAEFSIPSPRDTYISLLDLANKLGDEFKSIATDVPEKLSQDLPSSQLETIMERLGENEEILLNFIARAESFGADHIVSALETVESGYRSLTAAVRDHYAKAIKAERSERKRTS